MPQQINVQPEFLPKREMKRALLVLLFAFCPVRAAGAQHVSSLSAAVGAVTQDNAEVTASFAVSAGVDWWLPWLLVVETSVANLHQDSLVGTQRNVSLALLVTTELFGLDYTLVGAGFSLHDNRRDFVAAPDTRHLRVHDTLLLGLQVPVAGRGVTIEVLGRTDSETLGGARNTRLTGSLGVRYQPRFPNTLVRGEPQPAKVVAARAAVWNDVLMQLILLQQGLESFTRIKEIETGIELEFDQTAVTLYDDVAKAARVLAAAQPPVMLTVFAPNAGRVGAAATAGSFPAERMRLQRDERVFLRVER
jgi:hypothetical protein